MAYTVMAYNILVYFRGSESGQVVMAYTVMASCTSLARESGQVSLGPAPTRPTSNRRAPLEAQCMAACCMPNRLFLSWMPAQDNSVGGCICVIAVLLLYRMAFLQDISVAGIPILLPNHVKVTWDAPRSIPRCPFLDPATHHTRNLGAHAHRRMWDARSHGGRIRFDILQLWPI